MIDLKTLNDDELRNLCSIVSFQTIKQIFIDHPTKCNKLLFGDGVIAKRQIMIFLR